MATIDVTDSPYNAAGDGTTDDTAAINSALDDATPGDTVLIPETSDSYLVSQGGSRAAIEMERCGDDVTITGETNSTGDGTDSLLKMADLDLSDGKNRWVAGFDDSNVSSPLTGVTVQKLRFNGNKAANSNGNFQVMCFNFHDEGSGYDVAFEDCIFEEAAGKGIELGSSEITLDRITCRKNARHGFGPGGTGAGSESDPGVVGTSIKIDDNGNGTNGTGMDVTGGYVELTDLYLNSNTQGSKIGATGGQPEYLMIKNANFRNAEVNSGWRYTGGDGNLSGVTIEFANVQFIDPWLDGMNLVDDAHYDFTEVLIDGANQEANSGQWGVRFDDGASASIDTLRVQNTNVEAGIHNKASGSIDITDYYHYNNDGGDVTGGSNSMNIGTKHNQQSSELDVPGPGDVGAFSNGSGDTTAPTAPSNLSSPGHTDTSVDLDWDASSDSGGSGLDHYNVYVDGAKDHEVGAGTTSTTVTGLSPSTSYDFHVTAVDGASNESSHSNTVTVTTDAGTGGSVSATKLRTSGGVVNARSGILKSTAGSTSSATVIDSFESGSLDSAWDGSTGRYTVVDASNYSFDAVDGSCVLECTADNGTGVIHSTSGLDNYFAKGTVGKLYARYDSTPDTSSEFRGWFGATDTDNYYDAIVDVDDGNFELRINDGGNYSTLVENTSLTLSTGQWYEVEITWDDGTLGGSDNDITLALSEYDTSDGTTTNVTTLSTVNDSTHATADGVGLRGYSNGSSQVHMDFYHLE